MPTPLFEGDPVDAVVVAAQAINLPGRSAVDLVFPFSVDSPGDRTYVVVADPDDLLVEDSEANNSWSLALDDQENTYDLEVRPEDITLSSSDLTVGDTLTVSALVHNRGTAPSRPLAP